MKVKPKDMTRTDALPLLQKMLKRTEGKRKRRALEIAIGVLQRATAPRSRSIASVA